MRLLLAVTCLLGAGATAYSIQPQHNTSEQQFRYKFVSSVFSGIPDIDSQYAGCRVSGESVIQLFTLGYKIQLQNLKFMNFNGQVEFETDPDNTFTDVKSSMSESEVPHEMKRYLEAPYEIIYDKNMMIKEIRVSSDEPVMVTNIKKALLQSQSHGWLKGTQMVETNMIHKNIKDDRQPMSSFKVMEKTFQGECEVAYTVTKLPEYQVIEFEEREQNPSAAEICKGHDYYQIVKNINIEDCKQRPIYQRTVGANSKSDRTEGASSPFVKEFTGEVAIHCGSLDQPITRKKTFGSQFTVSGNGRFDSQEKIQTSSQTKFELIKVEPKTSFGSLRSTKSFDDLSFHFPSGDFWSSSSSSQKLEQPDMTSAPVSLYPKLGSETEAKDKFVNTFVRMVQVSKHSPESSSKHEDVVNQVAQLSLWVSSLSYDDITDCWSRAHTKLSHSSLQYLETSLNMFCDILSMASTNPSVKFITEKMKNGQLKGESGAWIAANMIRSVRTPTEEVLEELTSLLMHESIQKDRTLRATVALSLTELIYKACIDETSMEFNFPTRVYGYFCSKESKVIRKTLVPFLKSSLYELKDQLKEEQPSSQTINHLITYINALGNLGIDATAETLLEVVDGTLTPHSHPRSLAVYRLIRTASRNPTKYKPIFLSIIQNSAENDEVRMAAITALVYCRPTSSDFQKLAVMTWFDASNQVSSYITSSLQSLKELPLGSYESEAKLSSKSEESLKLAKPVKYGLEKSQNVKIMNFLDNLRASVGLKLQYVNSEESAIPRNMYLKSVINSEVQEIKQLETSVYMQGVDQIIEKLQDLYKIFVTPSTSQQKQNEKLQFKSRSSKNPEAHVTLKMFDMERLFTIDKEFLKQVADELSHETDANGIRRDYMKVLDLTNHMSILPSAVGLPLYIKHVTPLIITSHTSIMIGRNKVVEIKAKPVFNYMQQTSVGTFCPFTREYMGTGVESSIHLTTPIRADINYQNGQSSLSLMTPQDDESQKDKPVVEFKVKPYTIKTDISNHIDEQKQELKTIFSNDEQYKKEYQLGKPFGIDLRAKIDSNMKNYDFFSILQYVMQHKPLTLMTLPLPLNSCKYHSVSLFYSPSSSKTKQATFVFTLGHASKLSKNESPKMHYPAIEVDEEIESQCKSELLTEKWNIEYENQKETQDRKFIQALQKEDLHQNERKEERQYLRCVQEKSCKKTKSTCHSMLRSESRPSHEVERLCSKKVEECRQRHESRMHTKAVLYRLRSGTSTTFSASLTLKSEQKEDRKFETHVCVSKSSDQKNNLQTDVDIDILAQPFSSQETFFLNMKTSNEMVKPSSKWDHSAILSQPLNGNLNIQTSFGVKGLTQIFSSLKIKSSQSEQLKKYVVESFESKSCLKQLKLGKKLTEECKTARLHATSLDVFETIVTIPSLSHFISENIYVKTFHDIIAALLHSSPYIQSKQDVDLNGEKNQINILMQIHPKGELMTMKLQGNGSEIVMKNIRIPSQVRGYLPYNDNLSGTEKLVNKMTYGNAPSTCSIENDRVKTFDNVEYDYGLNTCEHVVFKDCTESSRVEVTAQKMSSSTKIKVTIDNHVYEVEIPNPNQDTAASIKVNGKPKSYVTNSQKEKQSNSEFIAFENNYYEDVNTYVTSYEDGVYAIVSKLYGISVYADKESIEVNTFQHLFRNKACGLCGDLNDEKTADIKSAGECIMSSPKMSAYSYMIEQQCEGIPSEHKQQYLEETQKCLRKTTIPTEVSKIFNQKQSFYEKHLSEERNNQICISKEKVNICSSSSLPNEVINKKVHYFCVSKDSQGLKYQRMAEQGDDINEAFSFGTSYERFVSEPRKC